MGKKVSSATKPSSVILPLDTTPVNIGIDVSMKTLDIAVHEKPEHWTTENEPSAFPALVERLKQLQPERIIIEASGGYERVLVSWLSAAGLPVIVVNPSRVRYFARAIGKLAKTDRVDAFLLARFGATVKPAVIPLKPVETQALAYLVARRDQLVEMLGQEQIRLQMARRQAGPARIIKDLEEHLVELKAHLAQCDDELNHQLESSALWRAQDELSQGVPGIGPAISRVLIAYLPELGHASNPHLSGLCGVAPYTRQTGQWVGRSMISGGRGRVRTALYLAALVASRHNPVIKDLYQRLLKAGKAKKLALIACARKLVVILNAMARTQTPWQPRLKEENA
jgi:transposase